SLSTPPAPAHDYGSLRISLVINSLCLFGLFLQSHALVKPLFHQQAISERLKAPEPR
ncbi:hypothetical protein BS50DRAFT_621882, partial [Corynespora cassiicola Philippines]